MSEYSMYLCVCVYTILSVRVHYVCVDGKMAECEEREELVPRESLWPYVTNRKTIMNN